MSEIRERLEREWRYIAESPRPIFGGFHDRVIEVAKDSLKFLASLPSVAQQPQPRLICEGCNDSYSQDLAKLSKSPDTNRFCCLVCADKVRAASAPVQEEKCPKCGSADPEANGDPYVWCHHLWHSSGISEVSQGRVITDDYKDARGCAPSLNGMSPEEAIRRVRGCACDESGPCKMHAEDALSEVSQPNNEAHVNFAEGSERLFASAEQKVAEPTREWLESNGIIGPGIVEATFIIDEFVQWMEAYAAEQTASLRSQHAIDSIKLEVAHKALLVEIKRREAAESALRSQESAIDYDTEIATFDFIVSAIDTDHGYDIDKAKAAVWLRQFSERVRGRESATITKLPFNCPECGYAIHDEDDAALHLIRYGPKCGQASVEKGLVEALEWIAENFDRISCGTLGAAAREALTSYRQATQTQTESTKP